MSESQAERHRKYRLKLLSEGRCIWCGKNKGEGTRSKLCDSCRDKSNASVKAYKEKMLAGLRCTSCGDDMGDSLYKRLCTKCGTKSAKRARKTPGDGVWRGASKSLVARRNRAKADAEAYGDDEIPY